MVERVYRRAGDFADFVRDARGDAALEVDGAMWDYWLNVLPPAFMGRTVLIADGRRVFASFGFAEGADEPVAFWREGARMFACRAVGV